MTGNVWAPAGVCPGRGNNARGATVVDIFAREQLTASRRPWSLVTLTIAVMLASTLFLTRFALTIGERELSMPLVVVSIGSVLLIIAGAVQISQTRVLLFCAAMATMLIATVLGGSVRVSWASYLNVVLVYACYLGVAPDEREFDRALGLFRTMMLIIAFAGIAQFFGQLVIKGPTLFT